LDAPSFAAELERLLGLYRRPITEVQFNLLGSHDTPRFKTLARADDSAYRLATLVQMTLPGTPSIYYGDEIGMEGGHDPGCRGGFPWDERAWDQELRKYVQRCVSLRQAHPALRRGDYQSLFAGQGVVAYGRRLGTETILVVLNSNHESAKVDLPVAGYLGEGTPLHDVWSQTERTVSQGRVPDIPVPARTGLALATKHRS
jgi:neopullulanase